MSYRDARRRREALKRMIQAEASFLSYLRETVGIDTSTFPYQDLHIPELGIVHRITFFPPHLKTRFLTWYHDIYLPSLNKKP
jgi:hypothetical protein